MVFTFFVLVAIAIEVVSSIAEFGDESEKLSTAIFGFATFNLVIAILSALFLILKAFCSKKDNGPSKTNDLEMNDVDNSSLLLKEDANQMP